MKYVTDYFWVVVCKNHRFHHKGNTGYEHKVQPGEAGAFSSLPMLPDNIDVRCDSCGDRYSYKLNEVMRDEVQVPEVFVPHPLMTVMPKNLIERHPQREQSLRAVLWLLFSAFAFAQSAHKSDFVSIDTGDPSWASLYFGDSVTLVGDTELIIHCDFNQGELIRNFHVYGKQKSSDSYPITCTQVNPRQLILDARPFPVNLTMYGYNTTPQNLTLTVDSANWRTVGHSRHAEHIATEKMTY